MRTVDHPPILFLAVVLLEKAIYMLGMCLTALKRLQSSGHTKTGKLGLLLRNLRRPVVWESSSIYIDLQCKVTRWLICL